MAASGCAGIVPNAFADETRARASPRSSMADFDCPMALHIKQFLRVFNDLFTLNLKKSNPRNKDRFYFHAL
jgi:hypothetical protein